MSTEEQNPVEQMVSDVLHPELDRFANSFASESVLHTRLETLFSRIPNVNGVKVLQGTQEYGKDLVFYEKGTCGERRLVACVVKNDKISGSIGSQSGAARVLYQVRQALKNAYTGTNGESEFVTHVYVISPWPCSQEAMNSIKGELESAKGQVAFVCGRDLFDLFRHHWASYIYFESNLLSLYLSSLEHLDENSAFANLMTRGGFTIDGISSLSRVYIPQNFHENIPRFTLADPFPGWRGLDIPTSKSDLRLTKRLFDDAKSLLESARLWSSKSSQGIDEALSSIDQLSGLVTQTWKRHYELAVDQARQTETLPPSERKFFAPTVVDQAHENMVKKLADLFASLAEEFERLTAELSRIIVTSNSDQLQSEPYLIFSKLRLASIEFPWVVLMEANDHTISYGEDLLDSYRGPLLIAGAAGYGKTSFCRMATLRDSARFVEKRHQILPAYVQLYRLNLQKLQELDDPIEAFVDSPELRRYVNEKSAAGELVSLRIYLDGLDEVTDAKARAKIMELARIAEESKRCQVVVTSREHIVGSHLDWLPRLSLAPFNDDQMSTLAQKWLDHKESARFLAELDAAGELKRIIRVPLLANLTLAIFKEIGALPESTTRLYEMFVQLLCGGWDSAKNIRRDSEFGAGPKRTVITRVAWIAHNSRLRDFAEADFKSAVSQTLSGLTGQTSSLLRECIHDGILIQGGDRYAFAHLSFQEYLVANHLNDPRGYRQRTALRGYLEGDSWWTEVMRFFVAAAEDPNETAKWIVDVTEHISGRGHSHPTEIKSRADELISALEAYHKGFRPEKRTKKSLRRLSPTVK